MIAYCGLGCSKCDIERCAISKEISTCSECPDYKCDRIKKFYGEI
jgi:hypothetical protein